MKDLRVKQIVFISFMLFSMFFGAGNLIFPPLLGQQAGSHLWTTMFGFVISAVGLPLLGVAAVAKTGGFESLSKRVHPSFAILFPLVIYLSIGPGLAIPRAGSLAFEMGIGPYLTDEASTSIWMLSYSVVFFSLVFWLSLSPSKLVDRFGKILTPLLLTMIFIIFIKSLLTPMGSVSEPTGKYLQFPAFQGFLDGYQTMDALAALVYGVVVANAIESKGVTHAKTKSAYMVYAGLGAGALLTIIYLILGYLGSASLSLGEAENGAQILSLVMNHLFGTSGILLIGLVFTVACFCVSIGLVTSCSQFFAHAFPRISYPAWALTICLASMLIANMGLTQILKVSVPILGILYPVAIVLIFLALIHPWIDNHPKIYLTTVSCVGIFSMVEMINQTFLSGSWSSFVSWMPLYDQGMGWVLPSLLGIIIGLMTKQVHPKQQANN